MLNFHPRHLLVALASVLVADAFSTEAPSSPLTGVRISLYPKTGAGQSLKQTIKDAVAGISDLGVAVRPDDVSSALIGPEPALCCSRRRGPYLAEPVEPRGNRTCP